MVSVATKGDVCAIGTNGDDTKSVATKAVKAVKA